MRTDRYLKEKGRPGRQSGYTLMEVLTVLIIAGILATVAFHSYRQYKETAL
jgi:prepilin-type N-terminal cleavage/methylation domain-containing protein